MLRSLGTLLRFWPCVHSRSCLQLPQQLPASLPMLGRLLWLACAPYHPCLML